MGTDLISLCADVDGYRVTRDVPLPYTIAQPTNGQPEEEDEDELMPESSSGRAALTERFRSFLQREGGRRPGGYDDDSDDEHGEHDSPDGRTRGPEKTGASDGRLEEEIEHESASEQAVVQ
jgi:hypothetical protein